VIITEHAAILRFQGSVHQSWRYYRGRRVGPYYRLLYRNRGSQEIIYLGKDDILAEQVSALLRVWQAPMRERHYLSLLRSRARAAFRAHQRALDRELWNQGLYRKGNEIRGWRQPRPKGQVDE